MPTSISLELKRTELDKIITQVYNLSGIKLNLDKEELIKARLANRLRSLNMESINKYLKFIEQDNTGKELAMMIDVLTTNKTDFFREPQHFDFLCQNVLPEFKGKKLRIWSAGCSSGEEPYTLAMLINENLSLSDLKNARILATDISERMLDKARNNDFMSDRLNDVPKHFLNKYFICIQKNSKQIFQLNEEIKNLVWFAKLNLMESWPMQGCLNIIFCRNVMIYFDKMTRQQLMQKFWDKLEYNGYFFIGHSDIISDLEHNFQYIKPGIYKKQR